MLPELCPTGIHLLLNLLPCGPAPAIGTAGACTAQLAGDGESCLFSPALSFLHQRCSVGAETGHAKGVKTSREKRDCCLLAEVRGAQMGRVSWGEGGGGSASLAGTAGPYVMGRCVSPLADVVAPTVPQLQVPPCVWQSRQQGEVL